MAVQPSCPRLYLTLHIHLSGRRSGLGNASRAVPVVLMRSAAGSRSSRSGSRARSNRNSRAGSSSSSRRSRRGSRGRRNLVVMTGTPNTRNRDIVSVDLESKILESVGVADSLVRVGIQLDPELRGTRLRSARRCPHRLWGCARGGAEDRRPSRSW
jgi:hypothetical protein